MYSINVLPGGIFECLCRIQDGTERWEENSLENAISTMISAAWTMNGTRINRTMITVNNCDESYDERYKRGVKSSMLSEDAKLLDSIKTGHSKVLPFDDFRLKANLLPEEVDMIFAIREGRAKVVQR